MPRQIAIRLGTEGRAQVVADLDAIGTAGDAAARRTANAFIKASRDADQALEFANRQAKKLEALLPGLNPTKLDMAAGVRDGVGKSAESSAAVFSAAYAQMEQRANALRAAIDPAWAAQQRFDREIAEARTLIAAGAISLDDYAKAAWRAQQGLGAASAGQVSAGQSAGGMRTAMAGASYQVQDFITQLSMGANPVQAFIVQGGQLAGQFQFVEGKAGAAARFMMGPWGLAITAGTMLLAPLISKLWESGSALDKEVEKLKESARQSELTGQAKDAYRRTTEGVIAAIHAEVEATKKLIGVQRTEAETRNIVAKQAVDDARSRRAQAASELADAEERLTAQRLRAFGPGEAGERATGALPRYEAEVTRRRAELARLDAEIVRGEQSVQRSRLALAAERGKEATDAAKQIDKRFDAQRDALKAQRADQIANGRIIGAEEQRLFGEIETRRKKAHADEQERERDRQAGLRETRRELNKNTEETITSARMAKALMDDFAGIKITSHDRTRAEQAALYAKFLAGKGPLAAPPGRSAHEQGRALDLLKGPGISRESLQSFFDLRGIQAKIIDEGQHWHVQWEKGRFALDEFSDAAKRAEERQRALLDLMQRYDPAEAARLEYEAEAKRIDELAPPGQREEWKAVARRRYEDARKSALGDWLGGVVDPYRQEYEADSDRLDRANRARETLVDTLSDQRDRLAMGQRELQLLGVSDHYRSAELEKLRLILDYRRMGTAAASLDLEQLLRNVDKQAELNALILEQRSAWREIEGVGSSAIERLFDPSSAENWGERVKGILGDLQAEMVKLAIINPLKNLLFGQNNATLSSVFGLLGGKGKSLTVADGSSAPIGRNASGTQYWSGGATWLAENGPEIVDLPRGTRITPAAETRRRLAEEGGGLSGRLVIEVRSDNEMFTARVASISGNQIARAAPAIILGASQDIRAKSARRQQSSLSGW